MNPSDFLAEFQAEAGEKLDVIASQLLRLERDASNLQPVREMFLAAHTIKGGAAMLRLADVQALAHALEDLLAALRDRRQQLDAATADLLFEAIDRLRSLVNAAAPQTMDADPDPTVAEFTALLRRAPAPTAPPRHADREPAAPGQADSEPLAQGWARTEPVAPRWAARDSMAPARAGLESVTPSQTGAESVVPGWAGRERAGVAGRPRALLVDTSPTARELARLQLIEAGFEVECVADGHAALARVRGAPYQLVVAGLELHGLHGFDLAAAIRQTPGHEQVPLLLMSADITPDRTHRAATTAAHLLPRGSYASLTLLQAARALTSSPPSPPFS